MRACVCVWMCVQGVNSARILGSQFVNNNASAVTLYDVAVDRAEIDNCTFTRNSGDKGAALKADHCIAPITITRSVFESNSAKVRHANPRRATCDFKEPGCWR